MSRTNWRHQDDICTHYVAHRDGWDMHVWRKDGGHWFWSIEKVVNAGIFAWFMDCDSGLNAREAKLAATRCYQMMRFHEANRVR